MSSDAGLAPPPPAPAVAPAASPLCIAEVRLQDLRLIEDICIELSNITVLVGENNVGKTTLLRALDLALGSVRGEDDDFRVDGGGTRLTEFIIDVKIVPVAGAQFTDEAAGRLGDAVQLAAPQFATLRTRGTASADGSGPNLERRWLGGWSCDRAEALAFPELERPRADQLNLFTFFRLDARRDLVEELRQRRSYWGRLLSDVGIPPADRAELEASIAALGKDVVDKSIVLGSIRDELDVVEEGARCGCD